MKKKTFAKVAVLATAILTIAAWTYAHAYKLPEPPQFTNIPETELTASKFNVCEYERVRANLYDAALDMCIEASKGAYVWEEGVDAETKRIILEYRVPSLEVLLNAIDMMDEFGGDLADSFDIDFSPLGRFDQARKAYDNYLSRIK